MSTEDLGWKRRQEIPFPDVRAAADQFNDARCLLQRQPPGSGIVLPLLNCSAVALELYLKALASCQVRCDNDQRQGVQRIYAEAEEATHGLTRLFDAIPEDVRQKFNADYDAKVSTDPVKSLRESFAAYEGLFEASRYSYEKSQDITQYPLGQLAELLDFVAEFVARYPYEDRIHWS